MRRLEGFPSTCLKKISKVTDLFVLDDRGILYRLPHSIRGSRRDVVDNLRLVVPSSLREDMLHHAHEDFQGRHHGISRTHEKLRTEFYWPGMYTDVQHFVKECPVEKEASLMLDLRQGILNHVFVTHMPESARGNTIVLLFQYMFSGYVMCKSISATIAQDVAKAYEEQVFQRFGASSMIRHDQDPRFMSEVFTRFRELLGRRQRAILGYRPQANVQQERSVQTVIRSVRAHVAEMDQSD
ncbi:reverse transcriptase [Phytophthora megakarya]|uniref:Reverse transcriptase n=1 Tax=Phytophthora megakarya TaxID=4795 RepID=A0A225W9G9_9STRA|nr:reverse transcriptase [Phytophthora megakarya]